MSGSDVPWRRHAKERAQERHGLNYTRKMRKEMLSRIPMGEVLSEDPRGRQVIRISYQLEDIRVVYDKYLDDIVTILPK